MVHATGGLLKPQKCFWYMLGWIWKKGKKAHVLRLCMSCHNLHCSIPQSDGTQVPMQLKTISDLEKKLGVYTCPKGDFSYHVAQLLTTRLEHVERLGAWRLSARDAWMGTHYQLFPKLFMGPLQSLTHCRNWRKHFNLSGANCSLCYQELNKSRSDTPWASEHVLKFINTSLCGIGSNGMAGKHSVTDRIGAQIRLP
jgi:hypothetical protein